jgi:hypothetical protein
LLAGEFTETPVAALRALLEKIELLNSRACSALSLIEDYKQNAGLGMDLKELAQQLQMIGLNSKQIGLEKEYDWIQMEKQAVAIRIKDLEMKEAELEEQRRKSKKSYEEITNDTSLQMDKVTDQHTSHEDVVLGKDLNDVKLACTVSRSVKKTGKENSAHMEMRVEIAGEFVKRTADFIDGFKAENCTNRD